MITYQYKKLKALYQVGTPPTWYEAVSEFKHGSAMGRAVRDGRRADALRCDASLNAPPEQDPMDDASSQRRTPQL